ncbi:hypothetical protein GKR56_06935 [Providencia alcalifaciens]|uniref:Uncharacterized protein n=1 Tax=Providencia alcalifaciens DSM 30120 TaxID=520999 RepID=B6XDQ9_9GAMM|nr:hypothetical protein [Providencia alcalifaciens]ATG15962.1 hypothetical protein CO695_06540 [Providencia alcalifaciens]EEB46370.1 hypothetical protein PROVALCAL_01484 [Providencia alcalifaciens DSM 30120]MBF0691455.1 hypothetical protein [Providencia alcalifaciens]MTC30655.1 hypothetical protein [Providencia alcalifaciens]MTC52975.1 hypothetical protein [Providencia alcalifaciens]
MSYPSPLFSQTEKNLINLINSTSQFTWNNCIYDVIKASKPATSRGECKTDVFIKTLQGNFKISIKQSNADFLENKISYERAKQIFGDDTDSILRSSIGTIEQSFQNHPLICFKKMGRTEEKTILLGWKFELLNKKGGDKSGVLQLTDEQKLNVYSGHLLSSDKRNASVDGQVIADSGVADYILEIDEVSGHDLQFYINKLKPIWDFSRQQTIYFACKALNYRSLVDKWDGDRPLAVYVDWYLHQGELKSSICYDQPLQVKGNVVGNRVREILNELNITSDNFDELKEYYFGNTYP